MHPILPLVLNMVISGLGTMLGGAHDRALVWQGIVQIVLWAIGWSFLLLYGVTMGMFDAPLGIGLCFTGISSMWALMSSLELYVFHKGVQEENKPKTAEKTTAPAVEEPATISATPPAIDPAPTASPAESEVSGLTVHNDLSTRWNALQPATA